MVSILSLSSLFTVSCATQSLDRPKTIDESTELPPELQKLKVETDIKEAPPPVAAVPPKKAKKRKIKKGATTTTGKDLTPSPEPTPSPTGPQFGFKIKNRRRDTRDPFPVGETHIWNVGYLGFSAGTAIAKIESHKYINNRKVYHLHGTAKSSSIMNLFYSLDDIVESFIDFEGFFTHRFHMILDETKQKRDSIEIHNIENMSVFWWSRLNHAEKGFIEKKETHPITPYTQDMFSALFYLRTLHLHDGKVAKFPIAVEGKELEAEVEVVRHEECHTVVGKRRCAVLKPETKLQGVLQKTADNFIWITDDDQRLIVKIEANVKIGSIAVTLEKYEPGQAQ